MQRVSRLPKRSACRHSLVRVLLLNVFSREGPGYLLRMWLSQVLNWIRTILVSFLATTPTTTRIAQYHAFGTVSCSGPLSNASQTMQRLQDEPPQFVDLPVRGRSQISLCHSVWPYDLNRMLCGVYDMQDSVAHGRKADKCDPPRAGRQVRLRKARYGRNARSLFSDHRCMAPYTTPIEGGARSGQEGPGCCGLQLEEWVASGRSRRRIRD